MRRSFKFGLFSLAIAAAMFAATIALGAYVAPEITGSLKSNVVSQLVVGNDAAASFTASFTDGNSTKGTPAFTYRIYKDGEATPFVTGTRPAGNLSSVTFAAPITKPGDLVVRLTVQPDGDPAERQLHQISAMVWSEGFPLLSTVGTTSFNYPGSIGPFTVYNKGDLDVTTTYEVLVQDGGKQDATGNWVWPDSAPHVVVEAKEITVKGNSSVTIPAIKIPLRAGLANYELQIPFTTVKTSKNGVPLTWGINNGGRAWQTIVK